MISSLGAEPPGPGYRLVWLQRKAKLLCKSGRRGRGKWGAVGGVGQAGVGEEKANKMATVRSAPFQVTFPPVLLGNVREILGEAESLMDAGAGVGASGRRGTGP